MDGEKPLPLLICPECFMSCSKRSGPGVAAAQHRLEARCCAYDLLTLIPILSTDPVATKRKRERKRKRKRKRKSNPKYMSMVRPMRKFVERKSFAACPVSIECRVT
jgi:hypothetical protein